MRGLTLSRHTALTSTLVGFALINVALFLHPMSPEDFLELALVDPIATVAGAAQGSMMAVLFWCGIVLFLAGIAGLPERMNLRRHAAGGRRLPTVSTQR